MEEPSKARSLSVPLHLIGREALPVSINEMDMSAVTDVSVLPLCSAGSAVLLAGLISSFYKQGCT